ncbi:hypothetical protein C4D60_Mb07t18820 [Musa balbisiana]|uniref:Small ribosomal subunit protein uS8c n=1 Tax=Musa balbisiana TaxID=52838 RepID=A0A4S8JH11_MUSBA|nr:hypothetical protein C4D60_Mb07t18820 [Musa balbisiana]
MFLGIYGLTRMVRISVLNDALKSMYNAEKRGKRQKHGYIGEFEYVDDHRAGKIVVELNGRLNKCGVISPRFDVGVKEIEPWTARLLPSRQMLRGSSLFSPAADSNICHLITYKDKVISCLQIQSELMDGAN